ncbi:hypothetical protein R3X27_19140 [Tropicimonas sp. TH_r6]|nr:hypothetical protein [Tropicimonas sp. TH_r6]MDV7144801.1 hypothetical protein [Tropicimonas sp. TH_r6]
MFLTWHTLRYFLDVMAQARAIAHASFPAWEAGFHAARVDGDIEMV